MASACRVLWALLSLLLPVLLCLLLQQYTVGAAAVGHMWLHGSSSERHR